MNYPLSQVQLGVVAETLKSAENGGYNFPFLISLPEETDLPRLARALETAADVHPMLKARLVYDENGTPVLEDHGEEAFCVRFLTFPGKEALKTALSQDYDVFSDALYRVWICTLPEGKYLGMSFFHVISDSYCVQVFLDDVSAVYAGESPQAEAVSGFDLNLEEIEGRQSAKYAEDREYYTATLSGADECPSMPLPDITGDTEERYTACARVLTFDRAALARRCEALRASESRLFSAAYAYTLAAYTASDRVLFLTGHHGRGEQRLDRTFTMLVRTFPVCLDCGKASTVTELVRQFSGQFSQAKKHTMYSYADMAERLGISAGSCFVYHGALHDPTIRLNGKELMGESFLAPTPGLEFSLALTVVNGVYTLKCEYPAHRFSREFAEGFCETFEHVFSEMLVKEELGDITLCSPAQIEKLDSFIPASYPAYAGDEETVVSLFRAAAKKTPDGEALVFGEKRYTYRQLDEITDILACRIADTAPAAGEQGVVSVLVPRNEYMAILPLAASKAGFAFQPLDPAYPAERLNFMVQDVKAALVFVDPAMRDVLSGYHGAVILTSEIDAILAGGRAAPLPEPPKSDDAFILLYTSGSTGTPKGVILEQRNMALYCRWYARYFDRKPGEAVACYASFGFDAHMMELYGALTSGLVSHIIPEEIRLDLIALNDYFIKNNVVQTMMTTTVATQFAMSIDSTSLKVLITGGEKLASIDPPKGYTLYNCYGPTEATIHVTTIPVTEKEENIPIGPPLSIARCYVVDKFLHRVPVGAAGELLIAGPQVGRGYLNRPEKTAEVFISDPFCRETSPYLSRAYRSGDTVRFRADGRLEYIGRNDGQLKIHGYRIELKEIESVIREYPAVRDVTVQAFSAKSGDKFIAAYVVSGEKLDGEALKAFVASKKPAYMVPAAVVQLDAIPLNVNQKVDKKALPVPELGTDGEEEKAVSAAPMNVLETELHAIVAKVVGTEDFGVTEPLSRLGLSSITAIRLATLIYKKYAVSVKAGELVGGGTLQSIENAVLSCWMAGKSETEKPAAQESPAKAEKAAEYPLSFEQQGIYTECQASPDSTQYNTPFCVRFPGSIGAEKLKNAVREVVLAHPSYSVRFRANDKNEIVQSFAEDYEPDIPVRSVSENEFAEYKKAFVRPFSLNGEPLARFAIVEAEGLYLLADVHHLISDGASTDIFLRQLCACLDGVMPEKEAYTYFDYVTDEKISPETERFFEEQMAEYEEPTRLIPDVFEEGLPRTEGSVEVETDLRAVSAFAAEHGFTPAAVYLAAEYVAATRYTYEDRAAISTISGGRSNMRIHNTVGMFVNTLPLAVKIDSGEDCLAFVRRVSENFAATIAHENYPFALVAKKFDFHPALSYTYQVGVLTEYSAGGERIEPEELPLGKAKFPASVFINGSAESGGTVQVKYDESLYSAGMMRGFARSIANAVRGLMTEKTLADVSLTDEEQQRVLDGYNRPFDLDYDRSDTVVSAFRKQAAAHPDKTAAVYNEKTYTFRELDELTDRLAEIVYGELAAETGLTALREQVVPIITERNENAFLLPLAVLKAGCAYEPLDPDYPAERLSFMVSDAGAKLLLAERKLANTVSGYEGRVLLIEDVFARLAGGQTGAVPASAIPAPRPEDLMIMLYTSGTTGLPKGVQLIHENLVAFAHGSALDGLYTEESRTATYASFGFDVNMADTLCTLLNGGTVYLIPEEARMDLGALAAYFDREGVTDVLLTTQVGVQFINNYPQLKTLRMLTVGGEKLPAVNTWALSYTVYNGYGPTENCAGVSIFPIRRWEPNIPIGRPMPSIHGFVLDKTGHRLPAGAAGEYCLSGPQVARGYLNRPDKTAEAFEPCPFNAYRMYHTGDVVRYRDNGDVEFVGRKDSQVKIRGFRVELKEVEAVILGFDGVRDVTVQAYDYDSGGKYLAAFVVSDGTLDAKAVADYIRERKPAYMVPAVIQPIDTVPLTVNRKVDKKALPRPEIQKAEYTAPETETEEAFCRIFGEVLGVERFGAEDDFFDLGGSSISAMKVVLAAGKAGLEIVYQDVFDYSTPRRMAAYLGENAASSAPAGTADTAPETAQPEENGSIYGPRTTEIGRDGYDYTAINALLRKNTLETFRSGEKQKTGDVLLTGSTGFLGTHVLHDLLVNGSGTVWCLVRGKKGISAEDRLKEYLQYYFGSSYDGLFGNRIRVIEGDATDASTLEGFAPEGKNITVVNCAANVAHFARGDSIERTNVDSVAKLIDWCLAHDARLVHVSTGSVAGASVNGAPPESFRLDEHVLYAGQLVENNQYVHSKFMAERIIYEAILEKGLHAKVMRVTNLAPRFTDGTVQINYRTNNFLSTLRAYKALGLVSYDMMGVNTEFSPIDAVARAILTLAETPEECVCFILANEYRPYLGNVLMQLSTPEAPMRPAEPEELAAALSRALADPDKADVMRPLMAYSSSKKDGDVRTFGFDVLDASLTTQLLYRLGFRWPLTDDAYVRRFAQRLEKLGFFSEEI